MIGIDDPYNVFGFNMSDRNQILETLKAALPIVQFAVANLDPASVIWPYDVLRKFGEMLKECPGLDIYQHELGSNLVDFADEFRRLRKEYEAERDNHARSRAGG